METRGGGFSAEISGGPDLRLPHQKMVELKAGADGKLNAHKSFFEMRSLDELPFVLFDAAGDACLWGDRRAGFLESILRGAGKGFQSFSQTCPNRGTASLVKGKAGSGFWICPKNISTFFARLSDLFSIHSK